MRKAFRLLFLLCGLMLPLRAGELVLTGGESFDQVLAAMETVRDDRVDLTPEAVYAASGLDQVKKNNIGVTTDVYWTRLAVRNGADEKCEYIFANQRNAINAIDVHIFQNGTIRASHFIGDTRPMTHRSYRSFQSNFALTLEPGESVVIVSRLENVGPMDLGWHIYTPQSFLVRESVNVGIVGIFTGFVFSIVLYNLMIYLVVKVRFYLYFILYLVAGFFSQNLSGLYYVSEGVIPYGVFTHIGFIFVAFSNMFWHLVTLHFFDLKHRSPYWFYLFHIFIAWTAVHAVLFFLGYFIPGIMSVVPYSIVITGGIITPIIFFFAFWAVYKRYPGAIYFALATVTSKGMFVFFLFNFLVGANTSFLARYGVMFGVMAGAFFLSMAFSRWLKSMQEEATALRAEVEEQKKYAMIGSTISFIAHQWRQPLSRMGSILMNMNSTVDHDPRRPVESTKGDLYRMERAVELINRTITDIQNLFRTGTGKKVLFDVSEVMEAAIEQCEVEFTSYRIRLDRSLKQGCLLRGDRDLMQQALFNLLQNAVQVLTERKIADPQIRVRVACSDGMIELDVHDNGGGIHFTPIESVFDLHVTDSLEGSGLGLALVKQIVEMKFGGEIRVMNDQDGACFRLVCPMAAAQG